MRRFAVIGLGRFRQKLVIALRPQSVDRLDTAIMGMGQGSEAFEADLAKLPQEQGQP